jgi:hypothetical protein
MTLGSRFLHEPPVPTLAVARRPSISTMRRNIGGSGFAVGPGDEYNAGTFPLRSVPPSIGLPP